MGKRRKFEERETFNVKFEGWEANDLRVVAEERRMSVGELIRNIVVQTLRKPPTNAADDPRHYAEFWPDE